MIGNHRKIHLFKIIEILNKFKIFKYHPIGKFNNIIDLRKLDFLSEEKLFALILHNKSLKVKPLLFYLKLDSTISVWM